MVDYNKSKAAIQDTKIRLFFARELKKRREEKRLTIARLSKLSGVPCSKIAMAELGDEIAGHYALMLGNVVGLDLIKKSVAYAGHVLKNS